MSDAALPPETPQPLPAPQRRRHGPLVWIVVLAVLLAGAAAAGVLLYLQVQALQAEQRESERVNEEQRRLIEEQEELLDRKETFGAAMEDLMSLAKRLDGVPVGGLLDLGEIEGLAREAWEQRRSPDSVASLSSSVLERTEALRAALEAADAELAGNGSGTLGESLIDGLGAGHVRVVYDDPAALCGGDPIGCVASDDPTLVHLDAGDFGAEYFDDALRTLVAYHEFAHVLQFTNPEPTGSAASAFGEDWEFMADCYALTLTDGWSLERRVWVGDFSYWDVSVGYGRVCDEAQRDAIRGWLGDVGFHYRPVSQEA